MTVCIIKHGFNHEKQYQIMIPVRYGFNHVFPGKLFTLDEAKKICTDNNWIVKAIGDIWQCAD
jgi:hypothetical protein